MPTSEVPGDKPDALVEDVALSKDESRGWQRGDWRSVYVVLFHRSFLRRKNATLLPWCCIFSAMKLD